MSIEQNKQIARRFFEQFIGQGRFDVLAELTIPSFIDHSLPPGVTPAQIIGVFRAGFPDLTLTVEDQAAENDRVVTRWTVHGTHTGDFSGIPATGKTMTMPGITIQRLKNGKLVEAWVQYDQLGLLQQLGVIPTS